MFMHSRFLVFPEGETREIEHALRFNQVVDMNGFPLPTPIPSPRIIAYRVSRISNREATGTRDEYYYLERLSVFELQEFC